MARRSASGSHVDQQAQPRKPALKAYDAELKRGEKHEEILAGVKARVGVEKPDTVYAPMLSTWLNEERWKDAGGATVASAIDVEASEKARQIARDEYNASIRAAQERRRREWGMAS